MVSQVTYQILLLIFLYSRKKIVALNEQFSSWIRIETGFPQGLILGPLLIFNLY